jgi:hypothetical protein
VRARAGERGVALAVIAVVIAVAGALVVLANALQHMRAERARLGALDERFAAVTDSLVEFAIRHKRLPRPACARDDGVEAGAAGACGEEAGGTVPWRALALPEATARDPRGGNISYRVAEELTAERALIGLAPPYAGLGLTVCDAPECSVPRFDPAAGSGAAFALGDERVHAVGVGALLVEARLAISAGETEAGLGTPDRL